MKYILDESEYLALGPKTRIELLEAKLQTACHLLAAKCEYVDCPSSSISDGYCHNCDAYKNALCEYKYKRLPK